MADSPQNLDDVWAAVREYLQQPADPQDPTRLALTQQQRGYLLATKLAALIDGIAVLRVPADRIKQKFETELAAPIQEAFQAVTGTYTTLAVSVDKGLAQQMPTEIPEPAAAAPASGDYAEENPWFSADPDSATTAYSDAAYPDSHYSDTNYPESSYPEQNYPASSAASHPTGYRNAPTRGQHDQRRYENQGEHYAEPSYGMPPQQRLGTEADHFYRTAPGMSGAGQPHIPSEYQWRQTYAPENGYPSEQQYAGGQGGPTVGEFPGNMPNPFGIPPEERAAVPKLNANYTFDTYVVGDSNEFPWSAAKSVAANPGASYNPLFIWGGSGLGKTHLLHAIGNFAYQMNPRLRIKYVSSEEFTNDYINSLRDDNQVSFKNRYRNLDILMVDDIQFLEGKEGTQEEFFHTFNSLEQAGHQIVLSSDRSPKELETLEDRLRTRFQSGLIVDVNPPNLETRIAILRKRANLQQIDASPEVFEFIANNIKSDVRQLEGALNRIVAEASMRKVQTIDLAIATSALDTFITKENTVRITVDSILNATAEYFSVQVDDIKGPGRRREISHPRQIAIYLCRQLTDLSYPRIGKQIGGRDHSTILNASQKIEKQVETNAEVRKQVELITQMVKYGER